MKLFRYALLCVGLLLAHGELWATAQSNDIPDGRAYGWVIDRRYESVHPHPRLFVSQDQLQRAIAGRGDSFADIQNTIAAAAENAVADGENPLAGETVWVRAIRMQERVMSLIVQWHLTQDPIYLEAAIRDTEIARGWTNRRQIGLPEGQFATIIAVVYDLLYDDLSPAQRDRLIHIAREDFLLPFLRRTAPEAREERLPGERRSWWQDNISNWNPVSSSGNGVLALAMYEHIPEAQLVIDRVHSTYDVIFEYLQDTEGGWVEGLGYWNWAIQYMAQFLISYERATGRVHSGFRSPGFRDTLTFGMYFVPHGEATGFGNNQHGNFSAQLAAALEHLGDEAGLMRAMEFFAVQDQAARRRAMLRTEQLGEPVSFRRAGGAHTLLLLPDAPARLPEPRTNKIHTFPQQGWSMLADQWPHPNVYAAVRGGQLGGHHTHQDLLSWHGVVGIERMIINVTASDYYQTAWSGRAHEIFEKGSASKNTLFIGGLSVYQGSPRQRGNQPARVHETHYQLPTGPALRLDATVAFWLTRGEPYVVARMFVILEDKGLLVLDHVHARGGHPVEARTFTDKQVSFEENSVFLEGQFETARMTFAANVPAVLRKAPALLTDGHRTPPTMMRWQTLRQGNFVTLASLLTRGSDAFDVVIDGGRDAIRVTVTSGDWSRELLFDGQLRPCKE